MKICKFFYKYYLENEKNLHITNDFIQLYAVCAEQLFRQSEQNFLRKYSHFFWYNRAAKELAEKAIICEPYKHEIDTITAIIKKIDPLEGISEILDGILLISGLLLAIPLIIFISQPVGLIALFFEIVLALLIAIKKFFLTKTELLQKINDKILFDARKIDKNYRTKEKLFALNVWNNSLSNKSTFSTLFFFLLVKLKFPRLYDLILFSLMEVVPKYTYSTINSNWIEKRIWLFNQYREKKPVIDAERRKIFFKS